VFGVLIMLGPVHLDLSILFFFLWSSLLCFHGVFCLFCLGSS